MDAYFTYTIAAVLCFCLLCVHMQSSLYLPLPSLVLKHPLAPLAHRQIYVILQVEIEQCNVHTYMQCMSCYIPYLCSCTTAVLRMYIMTIVEIAHRHAQLYGFVSCLGLLTDIYTCITNATMYHVCTYLCRQHTL